MLWIILPSEIYKFDELYKPAMQTQSEICKKFVDIVTVYGTNRKYRLV